MFFWGWRGGVPAEVCRQTVELRELCLSTEISRVQQKLCPLECMVSYRDWIWAFCLLLIHALLSLSVRAAFHLLHFPPDLSTFPNSSDPVLFSLLLSPPRPSYPLLSPPVLLCSCSCFCPHLNSVLCLLVISCVLPDPPCYFLLVSPWPPPFSIVCPNPSFSIVCVYIRFESEPLIDTVYFLQFYSCKIHVISFYEQ